MKNIRKFILLILLLVISCFTFPLGVFARTPSVKIYFEDPTFGDKSYFIVENYDAFKLKVYRQDEPSTQVILKYNWAGNITSVEGAFSEYVKYSVNYVFDVDSEGFVTNMPTEVIYDTESNYPETKIIFSNKNNNLENIENEDGTITKPDGSPLGDQQQQTDFDICGLTVDVLNWVRMLIPIVIILLSSMDFFKAVFANEDDAMKKAYAKLIKRLLIAAIIFVVPTILKWLISSVLPEIFNNWFVEWCSSIK